ncbi:hypothetical protein FNAPI_9834 [Fusarium napiforme]|uniref:Uncharacterized protein n=1 Tax=Fusarium napiforme TaxID=42672 RepID=A0A8H5MUL3_9HYPO|nr:hypothetical protein FNAPI_9834 [Fusarium napiforme]
MASQGKASKNIDEFLQRHPEVGRHASGHAELEHIHHRGDTFCLVLKLFDNAILHREYDMDSMKLVYAHVYVDEEQAMSSVGYESGSFLCDCEVGMEEGMDHYLHEFMRVVEADFQSRQTAKTTPALAPVSSHRQQRGKYHVVIQVAKHIT